MPPLRAEEYRALKTSIRKNGVLVPVEIDAETGELLDGHHRMRACDELGIDPPVRERSFATDTERKEHALTLNLTRRHLGPISWAESFRKLAEVRGVRLGRGGDRRSTATVAVDSVKTLSDEAPEVRRVQGPPCLLARPRQAGGGPLVAPRLQTFSQTDPPAGSVSLPEGGGEYLRTNPDSKPGNNLDEVVRD